MRGVLGYVLVRFIHGLSVLFGPVPALLFYAQPPGNHQQEPHHHEGTSGAAEVPGFRGRCGRGNEIRRRCLGRGAPSCREPIRARVLGPKGRRPWGLPILPQEKRRPLPVLFLGEAPRGGPGHGRSDETLQAGGVAEARQMARADERRYRRGQRKAILIRPSTMASRLPAVAVLRWVEGTKLRREPLTAVAMAGHAVGPVGVRAQIRLIWVGGKLGRRQTVFGRRRRRRIAARRRLRGGG